MKNDTVHLVGTQPAGAQSNFMASPAGLMPLSAAFPDVSPVSTWRWRRNGWLNTTNISGRVYITYQNLAEFQRRAENGEFAKRHPVPANPKAIKEAA